MQLKRFLFILTLVTSSSLVFSQGQKFTISGQITDAANGEDIPYATVVVSNLSGVGTISNDYGFYSISLPAGKHTLQFQYVGYKTIQQEVDLQTDMKINVEIRSASQELTEVVVSAKKEDQNITTNEGSVTKINMREIKQISAFGGEPDVIKVLQLNPGVKSAGEGNAGFYVRGGGLDQNLVLLDEAPVYNPSHLLGFFSVFNGDALKSATIYKGGMAAEYGGRTSSVMDLRMKDGNSKKLNVTGGLGLIASRLTVEAPIVKNKGSFMVSGRRTYADLFLRASSDESLSNSSLFFYDLNMKANYKLGEKDRVFLSGYFGRDRFGFDGSFGLNWGNATGTIRWNHLFSKKLFSNTSLIYSDYDYEFAFNSDEDRLGLQSVIRDINFKQDFSWFPNANNTVKFGFNVIHHTIEPGNLNAGANTGVNASDADPKYGLESALYLQNEQKVNTRLSLSYGLRYSFFNQLGAGTSFNFDESGTLISEETFDSWENMQFYNGLEPRFSGNYRLNSTSSLKLGYNRNYQYIHLLTNATSSTPTDVWVMSSNNIKPQIADQVSLGYFRNFKENMYETSVEVYYKDMQNVIDYRNGANVFFNEELEGDLVYGDGEAYGIEFQAKKTKGRLTGWISYTLSRTLRQFDEINNGDKFPARQDRIHDVAVVALYRLSKKLTLSGNFLYNTGDAVTFPTGRYVVNGMVVPIYTERNSYRMPDYHRLDLGVTWQRKKTEKYESSWNFSIYNVYGRENAFTIDFRPQEDNPAVTEAVQLSLFKWVPSITYNFKFK